MRRRVKNSARSRLAFRRRPVGGRRGVRLLVEELESRQLLSANWSIPPLPIVASGTNLTLDQAQNFGVLGSNQLVGAFGTIGNKSVGVSEVDFYSFTLTQATQVQIATPDHQFGSHFVSELSLFDTDPQDPMGNRLIAQADGAGHGGDASLTETLGPGTYYVGVSGSGNRYFYPYLSGSGEAGSTGPYGLFIRTSPTTLQPGDGPAVLSSDPASGSVLSSSPFALRVALSGAIDPNTIIPGDTVSLLYSPDGNFGSNGSQVALASVTLDNVTNELVLTPGQPLAPGFYQILLNGDETIHTNVLATGPETDLTEKELGTNILHPEGQDYTINFQVNGVLGNKAPGAGAADTPATAQQLGDLTHAGLVQVVGAIGNDPTDPSQSFNPSDVMLYHFRVSGPGNYALAAEVFAGRIDSSLDPAVTLFRLAPDGSLQFVASNGNTQNTSAATNGAMPLFTDAAFTAPLTAGDYYLAVSSGFNYVDPTSGLVAGQNGVFDPTVSHSGQNGNSVGPYVLNLSVQAPASAPHVIATSVANGAYLKDPPTTFTIRFDSPVNIAQLAFNAYNHTGSSQLACAYIQESDGTIYYPRLQSYDPTTNTATFVMLDACAPGQYAFHLSGAQGLTGLAGNALAGNDPSGDFVIHFKVGNTSRGAWGNPTCWMDNGGNNNPSTPQILGALFPHELQAGVMIERAASPALRNAAGSTTDYYQFTVLQSQDYLISLSSTSGLPAGTLPQIWCPNGTLLTPIPQGQNAILVHLDPGTYVVGVNWGGAGPHANANPQDVGYQLHLTLLGSAEVATPLTTGPAPAVSLQLASDPSATGPSTTSTPNLPTVALAPSGGTIQPVVSSSAPNVSLPDGLFLALSTGPLGGAVDGGTNLVAPASDTALAAGPNAAQGYRRTGASSLLLTGLSSDPAPQAQAAVADAREKAAPAPRPAVDPAAAGKFMDRLVTGMAKVFQDDLKALDTLFANRGELPFFSVAGSLAKRNRNPIIPSVRQLAALSLQALGHVMQSGATFEEDVAEADGSAWTPSAKLTCAGLLGAGVMLGMLWNQSGSRTASNLNQPLDGNKQGEGPTETT